jgi:biopolymer transport protein TolR
MAISSRKQRRKAMAEINVVPYIDVMLVLLVIFMITAPLLSQGVRVDLPQANAKPLAVKQQEPIIVSVDKRGQYYLSVAQDPQTPLMPQQLINRVAAELAIAAQQGEKSTVLVRGDKNVDYGKVVQAMVLLQHAGVEKIGLMTQEESEVN